MIDLHTHILFGVDDGAEDLTEAAAMCRMAAKDGCTALIATPHQRHPLFWNDDLEHQNRQFEALQNEVGEELELVLGAEIHVDSRDILAAVDEGSVRTLGDSHYLLLELSRQSETVDPEWLVHETLIAGFTPILAHPECIPWLSSNLPRIQRLLDLGALVQITSTSLLGDFGSGPGDAALKMMAADLVHFVASDCHSTTRRPPGLSAARRYITEAYGADRAETVLVTNPKSVLTDQPILVAV